MIDFMLGTHELTAASASLAVLVTVSAFVTYARLAFESGPRRMFWPRSVMAVGFTLLALRFWVSMYLGLGISVPPLALIALGMIFGGYSVVQLRSIKRAIQMERANIKCFRDPKFVCEREDRVHMATLKKNGGA